MKLRGQKVWLVLGVTLILGTLACHTTDVFFAQAAPTATRTRTLARPTFTPMPSATATLVPTPIPPSPTIKPTLRPTVRPTTRPPTARPATVPPAATAFPYVYHAYYEKCEHSGMAYIKGAVVADKNDPANTKIAGVTLRLSTSPDGPSAGDVTVEYDDYTFILNDKGPRPGTYYVWVIDGSGNRISEISPPIVMNNLGPGDPKACWAAWVWFWKEPGR